MQEMTLGEAERHAKTLGAVLAGEKFLPRALQPYQNILPQAMRNILAHRCLSKVKTLEYEAVTAAALVQEGTVLHKQDAGFCQSYLVEHSGSVFFCSISTIYKFEEPTNHD